MKNSKNRPTFLHFVAKFVKAFAFDFRHLRVRSIFAGILSVEVKAACILIVGAQASPFSRVSEN